MHAQDQDRSTGSAVTGTFTEDEIVSMATEIVRRRVSQEFSQPYLKVANAKKHAFLKMSGKDTEVFAVMFLDTKKRMIGFKEMFFGTHDRVSVYPREVVREALALNAGSIVLIHNHPSGDTTPSEQDIVITKLVCEACQLVDIKVIDHLIVGDSVLSFVESGIMYGKEANS